MFNKTEKRNLREMMNYKKDDLEEAFNNLIKHFPVLDYDDPFTYALLYSLKKDLTDDDKELLHNLIQQKAAEEYEKYKITIKNFNLDTNNDNREQIN